MVLRLLSGILATVFLPLGIAFVLLGGEFERIGLTFAVTGAATLVIFATATQRERARRGRRTGRATAEVVSAAINHGVQLGARRQLKLTVSFVPAGTVSGSFFWYPSTSVGDRIDVLYEPGDPGNFEPVDPTGRTGIMRA